MWGASQEGPGQPALRPGPPARGRAAPRPGRTEPAPAPGSVHSQTRRPRARWGQASPWAPSTAGPEPSVSRLPSWLSLLRLPPTWAQAVPTTSRAGALPGLRTGCPRAPHVSPGAQLRCLGCKDALRPHTHGRLGPSPFPFFLGTLVTGNTEPFSVLPASGCPGLPRCPRPAACGAWLEAPRAAPPSSRASVYPSGKRAE